MKSFLDKKKQESAEIARLTEEYLKKGNKIKVLGYGDTGFIAMSLRELNSYKRMNGGSVLDFTSKKRNT
jgi:hypothetical protein